ncbi:MAG: hypothetical protein HOO06_00945 [Bdellovibrionaceae bacterium]|jgi:hypothetical protein|nr:hypothetical protein [Pseudobdellovibrionaceae bacterium]
MKLVKLIFVLNLVHTILGCANHAMSVDGINNPLVQIKASVIKSLPLGLRKSSINGREFESKFYVVKGKKAVAAKSRPLRNMARITILGDRRPYTIEVKVFVQKRVGYSDINGHVYKNLRYDKQQARHIAQGIKKRLTNRREDMNVIDDFRVF